MICMEKAGNIMCVRIEKVEKIMLVYGKSVKN
jgi:hypothetical protein